MLLLKTIIVVVDLPVVEVVVEVVLHFVAAKIQATAATCQPFINACGDNVARAKAIVDYRVSDRHTNEDRAKEDRHSVHASLIADDRSPSTLSVVLLHDVVDMY